MERIVKIGAKRPRSPRDGACGRCFRLINATAEYRQQMVCLRCPCVGHVAARRPVEDRRSPRRKRVHVGSKMMGLNDVSKRVERDEVQQMDDGKSSQGSQGAGLKVALGVNRASLSLSFPLKSDQLRNELTKVAVLSIVGRGVN